MEDPQLYEQFKTEDEVIAFADLAKVSADHMLRKFNDAKDRDVICVFRFADNPNNRAILNQWRNRPL